MKRQLRGTVAFAVCGSFCTLGAAVAQAEQLVRQGWELLPVMSYAASATPFFRSIVFSLSTPRSTMPEAFIRRLPDKENSP